MSQPQLPSGFSIALASPPDDALGLPSRPRASSRHASPARAFSYPLSPAGHCNRHAEIALDWQLPTVNCKLSAAHCGRFFIPAGRWPLSAISFPCHCYKITLAKSFACHSYGKNRGRGSNQLSNIPASEGNGSRRLPLPESFGLPVGDRSPLVERCRGGLGRNHRKQGRGREFFRPNGWNFPVFHSPAARGNLPPIELPHGMLLARKGAP
jgi:hypothetical protein